MFLGRAFLITVSELLSLSDFALLYTSEPLSLFSDFFLYFSSQSVSVFVPLYDLDEVSKNQTYKLLVKFLMINPCVIENYIVNVTYVMNDNRLGCFLSEKQTCKITVEFHKVTPVKPFTDCLISCHTTSTLNKCKLVDTFSTIFPYIIKKISRK